MSILDKLDAAKKKVQRKTKSKKASKRAKARRIQREEPEGLTETAVVGRQKADELGTAIGELKQEAVGSPGSNVLSAASEKASAATKRASAAGKKASAASEKASGLGSGAEDVVGATESGELDLFDSRDTGGGGSMAPQEQNFPFDDMASSGSGKSMDDDLDMDLEGF